MNLIVSRVLDEPRIVESGYVLEGYPLTKDQLHFMQIEGIMPEKFGMNFKF